MKGRKARWETLPVIFSQHRDRSHRQRRVWFTFSGTKPTAEELMLKWPDEKQRLVYRTLRDEEENECRWVENAEDFRVTERTGADGRKFWREVIRAGEFTDEEESESWDEWMTEEGHFEEIQRLMDKD